MKLKKGLNKGQLEKILNRIKKANPKSNWVKYLQYHIKKASGGV